MLSMFKEKNKESYIFMCTKNGMIIHFFMCTKNGMIMSPPRAVFYLIKLPLKGKRNLSFTCCSWDAKRPHQRFALAIVISLLAT